jgi:phosphatidylserine/phosphatidylglycerophosphate/cardiolipin synthase-like enzyme
MKRPWMYAACSVAIACSTQADRVVGADKAGGSSLSWMGVYGEYERHAGGNPGTFTVLMNQDHLGLHAELGYRVDGGEWQAAPMDWTAQVDGNSLWRLSPDAAFPAGSTVEYFFHGWDDGGAHIWDSAGGANYELVLPDAYAETWLEPLDRGFWPDPDHEGVVWGYLDVAVENFAYDKTLAMRTELERDNGVIERFLYHLDYRGPLSDGRERWGTDLIELHLDSAHHGAITQLRGSLQALVDLDGDGPRELIPSEFAYQLASPAELAAPGTGLGAPAALEALDHHPLATADTSAADALDLEDGLPALEVSFSPYDDTEQRVIAEIDAVTAAQLADPGGVHTIHASVFDVNDRRIVDALLDAHAAGVEVTLLTAAYHMEPWRSWETEYPRLQQAGVNLVGVVRDESIAASMHTKFAIFDGQVVTTGSYNWETVSADDNAEDMLLIRSEALAAVYERMFAAVAAEPFQAWPADSAHPVEVYYAQEHDLAGVIVEALDAATDEVQVAMFTLRSMVDDGGRDVLDALVDAQARGVHVRLVLERNICDEGEYYGAITPDDGTDEWLASQGIEVVEIDIDDAGDEYAAMHHKFAVIDGETVLLGSANWSSMTQLSDDDLMVVHDAELAERYLGQITHLRRHYEAGFDPATAPATTVSFAVYQPATSWGQGVVVVGDIPELGDWDPAAGLALDGGSWPWWTGSVDIPAGVHFEYKLVLSDGSSVTWEPGDNRSHTADPSASSETISTSWGA